MPRFSWVRPFPFDRPSLIVNSRVHRASLGKIPMFPRGIRSLGLGIETKWLMTRTTSPPGVLNLVGKRHVSIIILCKIALEYEHFGFHLDDIFDWEVEQGGSYGADGPVVTLCDLWLEQFIYNN